ncbi:unnamed protein product [Linum tenue]|uniref:Uncharacterized protein n=1 Tax=Linum tenue TaxID=586396 RepID=A0AAV0NJI1_9ROSI|nr:unnamed protein product [Linum tenue]
MHIKISSPRVAMKMTAATRTARKKAMARGRRRRRKEKTPVLEGRKRWPSGRKTTTTATARRRRLLRDIGQRQELKQQQRDHE